MSDTTKVNRLLDLVKRPLQAKRKPSNFALYWAWIFYNAVALLFDTIAAGTVYVRIGSLFEGSWMTQRLHRECRDFLKYVQLDACSAESWGVASVHELAREHAPEDPEVRDRYRLLLEALGGTSADVTP